MTETQAPSTFRAGMSIRITWTSLATVHGFIVNRGPQAANSCSTAAGDTRPSER